LRTGGCGAQAPALNAALGRRVFRPDIFDQALGLRNSTSNLEHEKTTPSPDELVPA